MNRWHRPRRAELVAEADAVRSDLEDMTAQRDLLQHRVDTLLQALEDGRAERERALAQQRQDMKAARRSAVEAAYEPVQVGDCTKVRYTRHEDAEQHAIRVAIADPGAALMAYQCRVCPAYRITGERPWHAGGTQRRRHGAMWADETTLYHQCGCQFRINQDGPDYFCEPHRLPAASAESA